MLLIPLYSSFPMAQSVRCLYVKLSCAVLSLSPPSHHPRPDREGLAPGDRLYRWSEISPYAKAQELLRQGHSYLLRQGHSYLDGDGNGKACEALR